MDFPFVLGVLAEAGYAGYCTVVTEYDDPEQWERDAEAAWHTLAPILARSAVTHSAG